MLIGDADAARVLRQLFPEWVIAYGDGTWTASRSIAFEAASPAELGARLEEVQGVRGHVDGVEMLNRLAREAPLSECF